MSAIKAPQTSISFAATAAKLLEFCVLSAGHRLHWTISEKVSTSLDYCHTCLKHSSHYFALLCTHWQCLSFVTCLSCSGVKSAPISGSRKKTLCVHGNSFCWQLKVWPAFLLGDLFTYKVFERVFSVSGRLNWGNRHSFFNVLTTPLPLWHWLASCVPMCRYIFSLTLTHSLTITKTKSGTNAHIQGQLDSW